MVKLRRCSRTACSLPAIATLTYAYAESTAVVGPLAPYVEPHTYDLCGMHAGRLTAPRGWAVLRIEGDAAAAPSHDDLEAVGNAVRAAARPQDGPPPTSELGRRGHLRVLPTPS
ncbi:MAG: DUF3499 domain-containing protein [Mycobacteriales bacterium]